MSILVPDGARSAPDPSVVAPARRILVMTGAAVLVVSLGALACLAVVGYQVSHGHLVHYGNVWLPVLAVALLWSLHSTLRASLPPVPGVRVDRRTAPGLMDLVDAAASTVRAVPPRVLLGLDCHARLVHQDGELVLVIGAPLVWGLTADELRRVLLPVLAAAPEHELRSVRRATAVAARLDRAPLDRSVTGPLLRRLRTACQRATAELQVRSRAAAAARVGSEPTSRPEDLPHLSGAWEVVVRGLAVPAWARGHRMTRVHAAVADAVSGSEQVWWTGDRPPVELDLVQDPERLDAELSQLLAAEGWGGRPGQPLEWPDYLETVVAPARREAAAALLAAVDLVLGKSGAATPARVLDALRSGAAPAVAGVLAPRRAEDAEVPAEHALATALHALVECAAVTGGRARLGVSWWTGPLLVEQEGRVLPHLFEDCERAAHGRTDDLRTALVERGIALDAPVWVAGDEPADVGPTPVAALADLWHRGRTYDLVVCEDRLVLLMTAGRGMDLRGALEHCAGDDLRTDDRLQRLLSCDLEAAVADGEHDLDVPLADIVDVRIRAVFGQLMWRTVITTVDRRIVLWNGRSPRNVFVLRELLTPALGDRLRVRGVDPRFPRLARFAPTWTLTCAGLAAVLLAAAGWMAAAGQVVPAVVEQRLTPARCLVQYVDPWEPELVRAEVDCPTDAAVPVDVLALPTPLSGATGTAGAGTALAVALALLLGPAAVGVALRTSRSRRDGRSR